MVHIYAKFNFETCAVQHCTAVADYLKEKQYVRTSEEEFIADYLALPHDHSRKNANTPHNLRHQYRHLQNKFGFFLGEA